MKEWIYIDNIERAGDKPAGIAGSKLTRNDLLPGAAEMVSVLLDEDISGFYEELEALYDTNDYQEIREIFEDLCKHFGRPVTGCIKRTLDDPKGLLGFTADCLADLEEIVV